MLIVREAVYEGCFDTPKTSAGIRQIPLSEGTLKLVAGWEARAKRTEPDALVFSTWSGKPDLYHSYQALLLPSLPLSPTAATALARRDPGAMTR